MALTSDKKICYADGVDVSPVFHPFPRLPFEIRSTIFRFALEPLPPARLIEVHAEINPKPPFDRHEDESRGRFPTRSKFARFYDPAASTPSGLALLWSSPESRLVAQSYYSFTCSDTPLAAGPISASSHEVCTTEKPAFKNPGILFNPNRDLVYFRQRHGIAAFSYARSSELKTSNIKVLALDLYLWRHVLISRQLFEGWEEDLPFLVGLERLIIVLENEQGSRSILDASVVDDGPAREELREVVLRKLGGCERLREGIVVLVVRRNELAGLVQGDEE